MPGLPEEKEHALLAASELLRQKMLCDVLFGACGGGEYEQAAGGRLGGFSLCVLGAAEGGERPAAASAMLQALGGLPNCRGASAFSVAPGRVAVFAERTWQIGSRPGCEELRAALSARLGFGVDAEAAEGSGAEELHAAYLMCDRSLNGRLLRRVPANREERSGAAAAVKSVKPVLSKAMDYIEKHFTEAITLQDVAEHAFASPFYISRLFKKELGVSFVDYLGKLRVDNARRLLCETNLRILEVSERVGIQDAHYFAKLFKKHAGMSPTEFRTGNKL